MRRTFRSLLWSLPALLLAAAAGIAPDAFLDSPYMTIPHEAAYLIRGWMIVGAFAYIVVVIGVRVVIYLGKRSIVDERRGFSVVMTDAPEQSAG